MTMSAHNDYGPVCHMACCGGPKDGCCCWMCSPQDFPWGEYDSVEDAAADWGRWYDGEPCPPEPTPDPGEHERYARAMRARTLRARREAEEKRQREEADRAS